MARAAGLILAALLLAGCGDTPAGGALRRWLPVAAAPAAEALPPGAGPLLLLDAPRRAVLVPVTQSGARRLWRGEGGVAIATEGARIVATAGLGQLLMATRFEGPDPLEDPRALLGRQVAARRTVDLAGADRDPAGMRFGIVLACTLRGRAEAGLLLVEERCTADSLSFGNRFWADPATGAVLRSEQWIGDALQPAVIVARD